MSHSASTESCAAMMACVKSGQRDSDDGGRCWAGGSRRRRSERAALAPGGFARRGFQPATSIRRRLAETEFSRWAALASLTPSPPPTFTRLGDVGKAARQPQRPPVLQVMMVAAAAEETGAGWHALERDGL